MRTPSDPSEAPGGAPAGAGSPLTRLWAAAAEDAAPAPRAGLSRGAVVAAGVALADEHGLDALSMARVAQALDAGTMSLYRHVASKDELLLFMHDAVWRLPAEMGALPSGRGWRQDLTRWCVAQQAVLRAHPWLDDIRLRERAGTPSQLAWMEAGLRALEPTGLPERDKAEVMLMLTGHVFWEAQFRLQAEAAEAADLAAGGAPGGFGRALRAVVDDARFPALRRAVDAGVFDDPVATYSELSFGLERILDGVERLVAERRG